MTDDDEGDVWLEQFYKARSATTRDPYLREFLVPATPPVLVPSQQVDLQEKQTPAVRRVLVGNSIEQSNLEFLARDPTRTLDVTALDLTRLPKHVQAVLYTEAMTVNLDLKSCGHIIARSAEHFSALELRSAWSIIIPSASIVSLPELGVSGKIIVSGAVTIFEASPHLNLKMVFPEHVAKRLAEARELTQRLAPKPDPAQTNLAVSLQDQTTSETVNSQEVKQPKISNSPGFRLRLSRHP
jgi:hypothetical protein